MWWATVCPSLDLAPRQHRQRVDLAADVEEGRAHAFVGERLEHLRRRPRVRAVVEGEDHFVVGERNGLGIGLQADQQAALRADLGDARRAELVGPAFGGRSAAEAGGEREEDGGEPHGEAFPDRDCPAIPWRVRRGRVKGGGL